MIPAGMGPYAFLYFVCPSKVIIQNLINTCFNESLRFLETIEKKKSVLPKTLGKAGMRSKTNTLSHDIVFR